MLHQSSIFVTSTHTNQSLSTAPAAVITGENPLMLIHSFIEEGMCQGHVELSRPQFQLRIRNVNQLWIISPSNVTNSQNDLGPFRIGTPLRNFLTTSEGNACNGPTELSERDGGGSGGIGFVHSE